MQGLNIHKGKTEILKYNTANANLITLDEEAMEGVESFTHLVRVIDEQGGHDADVEERVGRATVAFLRLKNVWKSK